MADNDIISTLPEAERQLLALCGITQDRQLAQIDPAALQKDLASAAEYFGDAAPDSLGIDQIERLCRQAAEKLLPPADERQPDRSGIPMLGFSDVPSHLPSFEPAHGSRRSSATGRVLLGAGTAAKAPEMDEGRKMDNPRSFAHAICCAHPLTVYLSAWLTWLLVATIALLVIGVLGLLIGIDYSGPGKPLAIVLCGIVVAYAILIRSATCSTCRIAIFSFRRYPRHRNAHNFLFFGRTLSTALSVIFLLRFRCPSCGTPQKLFGRRRRRHH